MFNNSNRVELVVRVSPVCHSSHSVAVCCCCCLTPAKLLSCCSTETNRHLVRDLLHTHNALWCLHIHTHSRFQLKYKQKTSTFVWVEFPLYLHYPPTFPPNMALWDMAHFSFTDSICHDNNGEVFSQKPALREM